MSEGVKLIFPTISARMREVDGEKYIWDSLRKKWLLLTPEEWVRQHTIAWLIESRGIPALRISQEYPVNVVIDESAKPYLLVECKAPEVAIDNEVVMQAIRYNAIVKARYILLTNGKALYCFEYADGKYRAVKEF